jgi:hypothetical protein
VARQKLRRGNKPHSLRRPASSMTDENRREQALKSTESGYVKWLFAMKRGGVPLKAP